SRDDNQRGARFRARLNRATTLYAVGPRTEGATADAQFAPKNGQKPKPIGLVAPQEGAETMPRGGGAIFCFFCLAGAWWPPRGEPNETRRVVPLADSWRPRGDRPIHHVAFGRACLASN